MSADDTDRRGTTTRTGSSRRSRPTTCSWPRPRGLPRPADLGRRRLTYARCLTPGSRTSEGVGDEFEVGAGDGDDVEADRVGVHLVWHAATRRRADGSGAAWRRSTAAEAGPKSAVRRAFTSLKTIGRAVEQDQVEFARRRPPVAIEHLVARGGGSGAAARSSPHCPRARFDRSGVVDGVRSWMTSVSRDGRGRCPMEGRPGGVTRSRGQKSRFSRILAALPLRSRR